MPPVCGFRNVTHGMTSTQKIPKNIMRFHVGNSFHDFMPPTRNIPKPIGNNRLLA
jgi:hypothetical protein